jgi:NAD-dependent SIR2 family protein deacetylase
MTLDPIIPLSVSIAEGERSYAFFLGSGISREAGIPTGSQILNDTKNLLYEFKTHKKAENRKEIKKWFSESEFHDFGYSEILEYLCPSLEDRRKFLEKYFLDVEPTVSHDLIADMVDKKLIKCIITTNFDRLMEKSLDKKGISYDVVSSEKDQEQLKPREHSNCRILKLHGDYHKFNIKNTKDELNKLESGIETEFNEVLEKFGIVVIGYSGSDNGVMECFENRMNPRYTLYWLKRGDINKRVEELIRQQDGKKLERDSADGFLKELSKKVEIFQAHETGETPEFIIQEVKACIKDYTIVHFQELANKQIKIIREKWNEIYCDTDEKYESLNTENEEEKTAVAKNGFKEFEFLSDVITAIGLVLIEYNVIEFFEYLLNTITEIYELPDMILEYLPEGSYSWNNRVMYIPRASIHHIYYCWGALAIKKENFEILNKLFDQKITTNNLFRPEMKSKFLWELLRGENISTFDRDSCEIFESLINSYDEKEFLNEFFRSGDDLKRYVYQFNFLLSLYSIKLYGKPGLYAHSSRLDELDIRKFIIPLLFKIKINGEFFESISKLFGDKMSSLTIEDYTFTDKYPERCHILNSWVDKGLEFDDIPFDYFNK